MAIGIGGFPNYGFPNYRFPNYIGSLFKASFGVASVAPVVDAVSAVAVDAQGSIDFARRYQAETFAALTQINGQARDLSAAARKLMSSASASALQQRSVTPSHDPNVAGAALSGANRASYTIRVSSLAQGQENTGTGLEASGASAVSAGANGFNITVNGVSKYVSFAVTAGDTNQTVLNNMASAINGAGAGVTASVVTNADATIALKLVAAKTGTDSTFTVVDSTGDAAAKTGAATVTKSAANASYTINGTPGTAQTNAIQADSGRVQFELKGITASDVTLKVEPDSSSIAKAVAGLETAFNKLASSLGVYTGRVSSGLAPSLGQAALRNRDELKDIGINVEDGSRISVDYTKLNNSIKNSFDKVSSALGGFRGLAGELESFGKRVSGSPPSRLAGPSLSVGASFGSQTTNLGALRAYNHRSQMTQLYGSGAFFSGLF